MEKYTLHEKLREYIEQTICRKLCTPKDFEYLAMRITATTKHYISPTTLKRFWSYIDKDKNNNPRLFTLNVLSEFIGYKDWYSFCNTSSFNGIANSDFINFKTIKTSSLMIKDQIRLFWKPNRCVMINYLGQDMFVVESSINSKLQVDDIFICTQFIENQPLVLTNLIRSGMPLTNYVCGKIDGIKFEVIHKSIHKGGK